jgi:His/Glu/Gln/Arg/opine family amino acid ABC transporter permease subunit
MYVFHFEVVWDYLPYIIEGLWITLSVTAASLFLGTLAGVAVALCRLSRNPLLRWPSAAYIEFFRNTPTLVKLMWVYYLVPILIGVQMSAFSSCVLAMSVSAAAYIAEIVRAGIQDVPKGDIDAARAVGMSGAQIMKRIVLPQAARKMLPPLAGTFIVFLKYSSLVSVLGVADLTYRANVVSTTTFRPLEVYTVLALFYFTLCFGLSRLFGTAETALKNDI